MEVGRVGVWLEVRREEERLELEEEEGRLVGGEGTREGWIGDWW